MSELKEMWADGRVCRDCGTPLDGPPADYQRRCQDCVDGLNAPRQHAPRRRLSAYSGVSNKPPASGPCRVCGYAYRRHSGNPMTRTIMRNFGKHEFEPVPPDQWGQVTGERGKVQL